MSERSRPRITPAPSAAKKGGRKAGGLTLATDSRLRCAWEDGPVARPEGIQFQYNSADGRRQAQGRARIGWVADVRPRHDHYNRPRATDSRPSPAKLSARLTIELLPSLATGAHFSGLAGFASSACVAFGFWAAGFWAAGFWAAGSWAAGFFSAGFFSPVADLPAAALAASTVLR